MTGSRALELMRVVISAVLRLLARVFLVGADRLEPKARPDAVAANGVGFVGEPSEPPQHWLDLVAGRRPLTGTPEAPRDHDGRAAADPTFRPLPTRAGLEGIAGEDLPPPQREDPAVAASSPARSVSEEVAAPGAPPPPVGRTRRTRAVIEELEPTPRPSTIPPRASWPEPPEPAEEVVAGSRPVRRHRRVPPAPTVSSEVHGTVTTKLAVGPIEEGHEVTPVRIDREARRPARGARKHAHQVATQAPVLLRDEWLPPREPEPPAEWTAPVGRWPDLPPPRTLDATEDPIRLRERLARLDEEQKRL